MKYSPAGRRFSLPSFDIFGQPMFEPYLYYGQFHSYPPLPTPLPPPQYQHPHPHQYQQPYPHNQHQHPYSHPHHGYQHPPEHPYFNIPETLPEEYFTPSSSSTTSFPSSPTNHYSISRETISPESSISSGINDTNSLISCPPSASSYSSSPPFPLSSSGSSPNSFPFGRSAPSFDVSRTETPRQSHHGVETDNMVVRTIPHPDTVQQQQEEYDGSQMRRKHSVPKVVGKHQQGGNGRALVVNGSTNDPIPSKASKQVQSATVNKVEGQSIKSQEILAPKPKGHVQTTPILAQASAEQAKPAVPEQNASKEIPSSKLVDESESAYVHVTLSHLPHSNKLNMIRLRANHTATANKPKLIEEAKSIFTTALQSHKLTEGVELGSWFSWTERGVNINFKTNSHRWVATENLDWLSEIGEGIRLNEKWGGIVVRDIWNPYILENTSPDDNNLKRKLEQLNVMSYAPNSNGDGGPVQESYRIRRIRWFGPSTLAIWFHDTTVAEYFAQKGVWFMEGLVGVGKNRKVGVCGLPTVYPLIEQHRNHRMVPHHVRRHGFVHPPTAHKEGPGGQHGRNNGEAKGGKLGWHPNY